jgi:hypothetical protein
MNVHIPAVAALDRNKVTSFVTEMNNFRKLMRKNIKNTGKTSKILINMKSIKSHICDHFYCEKASPPSQSLCLADKNINITVFHYHCIRVFSFSAHTLT